MKKINEILGLTIDEYEIERFNAYLGWCVKRSASILDIQKIMANSPINTYYNAQVADSEAEFLNQIKIFIDSPTVTYADRLNLYRRYLKKIEIDRVSPPLIAKAVGKRDKSQSLNISISVVAVMGVKLDKMPFRLN